LASEEAVETGERTLQPGLRRELGLLGLVAVSVCTVIGGGINVLSVEVQGKVPGVGALVPVAFVIGVTPALFCALAYASLASAMPRAGGGYIYVSRALHPFIGFMATASKWFGLASCVGVIAYLDVPLLRDAAELWGYPGIATVLDTSFGTLWLPLIMVWVFWFINLIGMRTFGATCTALMFLMLAGGAALIVTGFCKTPADFAAVMASGSSPVDVDAIVRESTAEPGGLGQLVKATGFLFFAYIGFATISQAGGETRDPVRVLPKAFIISTAVIAGYYVLYSAAVYHVVPWKYVDHAVTTSETGVSAPGLIGPLMPAAIAGFVAFTAAIALANDIPPMLMAVSRLFFSWARDGIFPRSLAGVNRVFHTPHWALTACALVGTAVIIECHVHGKAGFFAGIDTVTIALLFTYMMVSLSVIAFPRQNPELYKKVAFLRSRRAQVLVAIVALSTIGALLVIQINADLTQLGEVVGQGLADGASPASVWFTALSRSATVFWLAVMAVAAVIFTVMWRAARRRGEDPAVVFRTLPDEEPDAIEAAGIV
jgi:APA family basic amino acid/polyamine antiporter